MNEFSKTELIVRQLFIDYPETRENDNLLYHKYITTCTCVKNFERLFYDRKYMQDCNVISYKTIERIARKLREKIPEFKPSESSLEARSKKEEEYIAYSRT